tara:strand:+ start:100 stop:204 length:105 start_codon:yes stop_codon:yes gene_type:complete
LNLNLFGLSGGKLFLIGGAAILMIILYKKTVVKL